MGQDKNILIGEGEVEEEIKKMKQSKLCNDNH